MGFGLLEMSLCFFWNSPEFQVPFYVVIANNEPHHSQGNRLWVQASVCKDRTRHQVVKVWKLHLCSLGLAMFICTAESHGGIGKCEDQMGEGSSHYRKTEWGGGGPSVPQLHPCTRSSPGCPSWCQTPTYPQMLTKMPFLRHPSRRQPQT